MSNGSAILVAQLSEQTVSGAEKGRLHGVILLVSIGLAFSVFGVLCAPWLIGTLLNVKRRAIYKMSDAYFSVYAGGLIFQYTYNTISAISGR
jgi:Na+-driven multidrug efflux pump